MKLKKVLIKIILILLIIFVIFELVIICINNSIRIKTENDILKNSLPQDAIVLKSSSYIYTQLDCTTKGIGYGVEVDFKSNIPYENLHEIYFKPYSSDIFNQDDYYTVSFYCGSSNNEILTFCDIRVLIGNIYDFIITL